MRRSALFSALVALALLPLLAFAQPELTRQGDLWVRTFSGAAPAAPRLRINAHGPVTLEGGVSPNLSYQVKASVKTRTAVGARRILERCAVRLAPQGDWLVLTAPGGPFLTAVSVKAPRLTAAAVSTSDGAVDVRGIDGALVVSTGGGELYVDRVRGDCKLSTGGGDVRVGQVDGSLDAPPAPDASQWERCVEKPSSPPRVATSWPPKWADRCAPKRSPEAYTLPRPGAP